MRHFVVLSQQRTGSHLLMNRLNSHPLIHCHGDYLTADIRCHGAGWAFEQGFAPPPHRVVAGVGFLAKMHQGLHSLFGQHPGLKVLFLRRRNRLATLLSRNVSHQLGCYVAPDRGIDSVQESVRRRAALAPLVLPVAEAAEFFQEWETKDSEVLRCLEGTDWLPVFYEDLCRDTPAAMQAVYDHLETPWHPVQPTPGPGSVKEDPRPLRQALANYAELQQAFAATPWASFFEEEERS